MGGSQPRRLRPFSEPDLARLAPTQWGTTIRAVGQHDDVRPWLRAADVAVLASRYESGCIALGEALSCGTPAVTTDFAGASEAVMEGPEDPGGTVVPGSSAGRGSASGLLTALQELLGDPVLRQRRAEAARRRAERLFAPAAVLDRLDSAYALAVDRRQGARSGRVRRVRASRSFSAGPGRPRP